MLTRGGGGLTGGGGGQNQVERLDQAAIRLDETILIMSPTAT